MLISPINQSQNSFKAVNQKYYQWAKKEASELKCFAELLYRFKFDISRQKINPQDAIDTLKAIEEIYPPHRKDELIPVYDYIKTWLD